MDRHPFDDVLEADSAGFLGEDRERIRIPLDEHLAGLDLLAVLHLQPRAIHDVVALAVAALLIFDDERAVTVHDDQLAAFLVRLDDDQALVVDRAGVPRVERVLLGHARRRAADVERAHRQLRAGLADRLRGADVNESQATILRNTDQGRHPAAGRHEAVE